MTEIMAFILAGGKGERLLPLTKNRTKSAVPFGGSYRIIDFVLSNMINSGIYHIKVLTQFKSNSLNKHLANNWRLSSILGFYIDPVPAQMRKGNDWYKGTADAVYQNENLIMDENPQYVAVFASDHVYKMDIKQMLAFHKRKKADLTIAAIPAPLEKAKRYGVMTIDKNMRIIKFDEKPKNPNPMPNKKDYALCSMGNYIFTTDVLLDILQEDAKDSNSSHDFGKDIIPKMIKKGKKVFAYDFTKNRVPGITKREIGYWRDVGTIDDYYEGNMDLRAVDPIFNLYNKDWPIRSEIYSGPPAKFVFADEGRSGVAYDSIISNGCIISGGVVINSVLSPGVFVHSYSRVENSIIFNEVDIGRHCKIRNAIIDKYTKIPPKTIIGYDMEEDRKRFYVSPGGIIVITKQDF